MSNTKMNNVTLKIKKLNEDAILPSYANPGDAGMDLCSIQNLVIKPKEVVLVPTGIAVEIPDGMELQIRPRSGLALKKFITVLNSPGTIDSGYRGELKVMLINHSEEEVLIKKGERIAQMVLSKFESARIEEVLELTDTKRGTGGFGSTGSM